ncbi:MAG: hypothetical protein LLF94_02410 [Chlamydiales bacterium]|nr:hypothetical protein [Chlamydiales bacterium]
MTLPTTQVSSKVTDEQGIFALPDDTPESYTERAIKLTECQGRDVPECLIQVYEINPSWVPVEYARDGLRLWEAGCMWYSDSLDVAPMIQLVPAFEKNQTYLKLYDKSEVLAHEYVHAARANLGSSIFEEIFAYHLSASRLRATLGPLFERPYESILLLSSFIPLLLLMVKDLFVDSYNSGFLSNFFIPAASLPIALAGFFGLRLALRVSQWKCCKKHLDVITGGKSLPLMVRLTDQEILLFCRSSPQEIRDWITTQSPNFRWELLSRYLK